MELDAQGRKLLSLLISIMPKVIPGRPETYIGYKQCHDRLGLPQLREKWGESLKSQGLASLAEWSKYQGYPGITGLVIDRTSNSPGKGYFSLFGREEDDFTWWKEQIELSMAFDWAQFTDDEIVPIPVDYTVPDREEITTSRIIRDTIASRRVKMLNANECQICGVAIEMPEGKKYSEAHHIVPLGQPHNGPDVIENMICVCPNDHARLDYGAIKLDPKAIRFKQGHTISEEFINYHNEVVYRR
jgi:hypothetical protein